MRKIFLSQFGTPLEPPKVKNLNARETLIINHWTFINYLTNRMQLFRKYLLFLLLGPFSKGFSQQSLQDSIATERINLNKTNMTILGAWAAANIVQGSISAGNVGGSGHYLHQMNVYFNTVNLGLAAVNLLMVKKQLSRHYSLSDNLREQQKIEKILLFNVGLDLAYLTTGLYLKERGMRLSKEQPQGYGNSLLIQGGFLLIFDIIQYAGHRKNGKWMEKTFSNLQVGPVGDGLGVAYHFK